jgi:hypothetical protein
VPTLREQGVDVEFENWRSVVAPPGITSAQRVRLEQWIDAMVHSAPWQEALTKYRWIDRYLVGDPFARFVTAEEARVRPILRELGATGAGESLGPYPVFVLAGLVIFALASMAGPPGVGRVPHNEAGGPATSERAARGPALPILLVAAAVVINLLLAEIGGFVIASAALFWLTARAFDPSHPVRDALYAAAVSVGSYLLFARMLDLALPAGILAGLF